MSLLCSRSKKCSSVWRNTVQEPPSASAAILRDAVFDVVADTLEQRVKQVFLIFEMPIERAARYAGGLGDFVERGTRNPFAVKGFQGGKHQVFFGFQGFGFGFSHNGVFVSGRFDEGGL